MKKLFELLSQKMQEQFYGEITIRFRNGIPTIVTCLTQTKLD